MILTVDCSACSTSFPVDPRKVPAEGVYARCSVCEEVFFVEVATPVEELAPDLVPEVVPELTPEVAPPAAPELAQEDEPSSVASEPSYHISTPEPLSVPDSPVESAETDDWVFEVDPEVDSSVPEMERLDTVEEGLRAVREEGQSSPEPEAEEPEPEPAPSTAAEEPPPVEVPAPEPVAEVAPPPPPPSPDPPTPEPEAPAQGFKFGRRDPHEKASRLARVLVSDMIAYNPDRHQKALDGGTLKEDFEEEIEKSMAEYVEQVGKELAESTDYFEKALNEILARGQENF